MAPTNTNGLMWTYDPGEGDWGPARELCLGKVKTIKTPLHVKCGKTNIQTLPRMSKLSPKRSGVNILKIGSIQSATSLRKPVEVNVTQRCQDSGCCIILWAGFVFK